jgi:hypothetical protein
MNKLTFRLVHLVNGLVFLSLAATYQEAYKRAVVVSMLDLGREYDKDFEVIANSYKAFRRKHGINSPDSIAFNSQSIEQMDENGDWWVVGEDANEEPEFTLEEAIEAQMYPHDSND